MPPKENPPKKDLPVVKEAKPPDPKPTDTKPSPTQSGPAPASFPNHNTPGETSGAETKALEGATGGESVNPEMKPIDGMGMASDLKPLTGMDNPFEVVKWTYMSPALEKERKHKEIHTEVFWASGKPPKERDLQKEKELAKLLIPKPGDPDYCVLKYGDIPSPKPDYCTEHGWVSGPGSSQPRPKPQLSDKILKCLEMNQIESRGLPDCHSHGDLKINMFVEAELVETIDKWDIRKDTIILPCGFGHQPLRWLGQSACIRVAFLKDEAPSKFLPLAIKTADGLVLNPDKPIREILANGAKVTIDYSSGPSTFREPWLGQPPPPTTNELIQQFFESLPKEPVVADVPPPKPPPPKKKKKKKGVEETPPPPAPDPDNPDAPLEPPPPQFLDAEVQTPVDIITFLDWSAYDIPATLLRVMPHLDEAARNTEFMVVQEIMRAYSGAMQAMILWFSGQGKELEDKDFGLLTLEQFQKLFRVMKLCPYPFTENKLKEYFNKYVPINKVPGAFQLSSWGFFPMLLHLASDMYQELGPEVPYHEKIYHFIVDDFLPNFAIEVKSTLEDLHSAETPETADAIKDREETAKAALRVAIPEYLEGKPEPANLDPNAPSPGVPDLSTPELKAAAVEEAIAKAEEEEAKKKVSKDKEEPQPIVFANAWAQVDLEVDVKIIMPHFKKWLALGERWDDSLAAGVLIYALQTPTDIFEFSVKTATLRFGYSEIQRFLLAASHCIYKRTPLMRVSEHSFLRTYMQQVFIRAKVAQPLYKTYEEKLEYLRQQCFRHEAPLPKLPEKKKGFM
ncbi:hypothetical protein MPTK2_8g11740 [Marchantia polymorpha subsp. ruderalis]